MDLECYICHRPVKRHDYRHHVASHLAGNVTEMDSWVDPTVRMPQERPSHPSPQPVSTDNQKGPSGQSAEPNMFQTWLMNYAPSYAKYTTIDGQGHDSGLQELRQKAELLRSITKENVVHIVKAFRGSGDQATCLELIQKAPIFPGLVAYTYTHLVMCPSRGWFGSDDWSCYISELKRLVERWAKLLRATKIKPEDHKCNLGLLHGTTVLNYDVLNLAAMAALCITGPRKENILDRRGVQFGRVIGLFHDLLESNIELEDCYRRCFFNVLISLSKESGCCPRGIYIPEGTISSLESKSQGGFGLVSKGKLASRVVAVKFLKRGSSMSLPDYDKQVCNEAIVWRYLRHPNCLPLYGIYAMPPDAQSSGIALVSPWMDQGTLSSYLQRYPETNRTKLILDVVRGLTYLHTMKPHVAHRDIKPDNILITKKGRACLADFGLVSTFDAADDLHTAASQVQMGGTYNYMAPEILIAQDREEKRKVNKRACDMYALGCTIYAAHTGTAPFAKLAPQLLFANILAGKRPNFPVDKVSCDMWSFIENLWDSEPSKRLTAEMALDWMEERAFHEGIDPKLGQVDQEEEWDWKGQPDDKCLWSVVV